MKPTTLLCGVALALASASCSRQDPVAPSLPQVQKGSRKITGRVVLEGTPPEMKERLVTCDPGPGKPKIAIKDLTVRTSADGGLADVYVYIKDGPRGSGAAEPAVVLDQVGCAFAPHALAVQIGQPIKMRNSDPTFHNIHWDTSKNPSVNASFLPAPAAEQVRAFSAAEFIPIRCDVHEWMKSTIAVFDNPFFAVTDAEGRFEIQNLPPGTYTLTTYHPYYGEGKPQQLTVSDTDGQASFTYAAGK